MKADNSSRGMRNNNPLNIRHGKSRWQGMTEVQPDREFVSFRTLAYGYRAAWVLLNNYRFHLAKQGLCYNVTNIIRRWAPPEDRNDTTRYVDTVTRLSGLDRLAELPSATTPEGAEQIARPIVAMTCVECGLRPDFVAREPIAHGYHLAFGRRLAAASF